MQILLLITFSTLLVTSISDSQILSFARSLNPQRPRPGRLNRLKGFALKHRSTLLLLTLLRQLNPLKDCLGVPYIKLQLIISEIVLSFNRCLLLRKRKLWVTNCVGIVLAIFIPTAASRNLHARIVEEVMRLPCMRFI